MENIPIVPLYYAKERPVINLDGNIIMADDDRLPEKYRDQIEMKIIELKNILIKYYPGPGSNLLNSVLFDIFATEQDLASHNHVEDYLFVPAILTLEKTIQ